MCLGVVVHAFKASPVYKEISRLVRTVRTCLKRGRDLYADIYLGNEPSIK